MQNDNKKMQIIKYKTSSENKSIKINQKLLRKSKKVD